jgi:hypothetical protein
LSLSLIGLVDIVLLGVIRNTFLTWLALTSLAGLLISVAGLFSRPRNFAAWGVFFGILGALYLPTVFVPVFRHFGK